METPLTISSVSISELVIPESKVMLDSEHFLPSFCPSGVKLHLHRVGKTNILRYLTLYLNIIYLNTWHSQQMKKKSPLEHSIFILRS